MEVLLSRFEKPPHLSFTSQMGYKPIRWHSVLFASKGIEKKGVN